MSLDDISEEVQISSSTSSSSGGSSTSRHTLQGVSPSDFPVYVAETPYLVIKEADGEIEVVRYPETPEVEIRYDWYSDCDFENAGYFRENEGWKRWFWTRGEYMRIKRRVQERLGYDLKEILEEQPEKALDVIRMAANQKIAQKVEPKERCPVCSGRLHVLHDEWEIVDNRRVCSSHNVKELAAADLI